MKVLAIIALVFVLPLARSKPYERRKHHSGKRHHRDGTRLHENITLSKEKGSTQAVKHIQHGLKKVHGRIYKKFGMIAAPGVALEDSSPLQSPGQFQQPVQQLLAPVDNAGLTQRNIPAEMVSSYSSTPAQSSTLGTEVVGDQTAGTTQTVSNEGQNAGAVQTTSNEGGQTAGTVQTVTSEGGQSATVQYQGRPEGTERTVPELKVETQGGNGGAQTELAGAAATNVDPNAGSDSVQSFLQTDPGKEEDTKNLQVYSGPLPGSEQSKPQVDGLSPQEEVKVVNLGDDEKAATEEDRPCGGCPTGARCINGQCQIREADAEAQGLTGNGKDTNSGTVSDIHALQSQELKTLLKDATNADPAPGAIAETPTDSSTATEVQGLGQDQPQEEPDIQDQRKQQQQQTPVGQQADLQTTQGPMQQTQQQQQQQQRPTEAHFSSAQLKELRDFARMYKMYQFIRKMEERLNDPDCAPVCRKMCKEFCPAKCCRRHLMNATLLGSLTKIVNGTQGTGPKPSATTKPQKLDAALMEDDDEQNDKDENKINEKGGKKHVFIKIVRNNVLDRPRSHIQETE